MIWLCSFFAGAIWNMIVNIISVSLYFHNSNGHNTDRNVHAYFGAFFWKKVIKLRRSKKGDHFGNMIALLSLFKSLVHSPHYYPAVRYDVIQVSRRSYHNLLIIILCKRKKCILLSWCNCTQEVSESFHSNSPFSMCVVVLVEAQLRLQWATNKVMTKNAAGMLEKSICGLFPHGFPHQAKVRWRNYIICIK